MDTAKVRLTIPHGVDAARVTGGGDANLRALDKISSAHVTLRGDAVSISGETDEVELLTRLFNELFNVIEQGDAPSAEDVKRLYRSMSLHGRESSGFFDDVLLTYRGRTIRAKTVGQRRYIDAIRANTMTFCLGPAGTGKTYLAMAMAVSALKRHDVGRIVLTRPVVEAGENLGFLPGTLEDKIDPYVRPLFDALLDMMDSEKAAAMVDKGVIEIAPLAYMRGRTLNDAFVILDEAQNTTSEQMKMFLTRLGFNSKFVITGDATQRDLIGRRGGLTDIERILRGVDDVSFIHLDASDVVRHSLVGKIVQAYDAFEQKSAHGREVKRKDAHHGRTDQ